ncbi:MAG: flagellar basal body rod protein FlgB [Firmicutes bacterium]|nr:flagellar basal body rod protein FlgB [Bacillota bacterium]
MKKIAASLLLERALSAANLRQKILANNIANVDTPGYKRFDIALQEALQQGLDTPLENYIYRQSATSLRVDGNNVDIDQEMTFIAENEAYFNSVASSLIQRMATVRYLINEGRR